MRYGDEKMRQYQLNREREWQQKHDQLAPLPNGVYSAAIIMHGNPETHRLRIISSSYRPSGKRASFGAWADSP